MKKLSMALLVVFICGKLFAAEPPPPEELTQSVGKFFEALKKDKVEQAYDDLLKASKIKGNKEDVLKLKTNTREALTTFGPVLGFELLEQKRMGFSLMQLIYFSWHDERPLRWRFTFYRPKDKWRLVNIQLDDQAIEFFGSAPPPAPAESQ